MLSEKEITRKNIHPSPYGWMLFLFVILLLPNLSLLCFCTEFSLFKRIASLCFANMIWLLPALFLKARTYFLIMGIFLFPAPFEIVCDYLNKEPLTEGLVSAIFNTDIAEALEFITPFYGVIPLFLAIWAVYYWVAFKKIRTWDYLFPRRGKYALIAIFLFFNLGVWISMFAFNKRHLRDLWGTVNAANDSFLKKYQKVYPSSTLYLCYQTGKARRQLRAMRSELQGFHFDAAQSKKVSSREIYLLVIGESARYDHFGINGYERQTTPCLDKISGILSLKNVYATANLTEYALPFLLTRATPHTPELQYQEKALPDAFKEADFHTCWIANQGDNYPIIRRIAADADNRHFLVTAFNARGSRDEYLLPLLDDALNQEKDKLFIVLHTRGSHFQYDVRYPEGFREFTPCLEGEDLLDGSEECERRLINSYDNSILYTDYLIGQIVKRLERKDAVSSLIYVSDHAESLYEAPKRQVLHGNTVPSDEELHIPLLIWMSDKYKQAYPDKASRIIQNREKRLSSTNVFDTFLDMADIHYPGETLEQSFASPLFKEDSVRYILTPNQQIISKK